VGEEFAPFLEHDYQKSGEILPHLVAKYEIRINPDG
jgi:hypothetical protein